MTSLSNLKSAKEATENEVKKERDVAEKAPKTIEELKKALEVAKLAEDDTKREKVDIEVVLDLTEARAYSVEAREKLDQEALAKMEAEIEQRIAR